MHVLVPIDVIGRKAKALLERLELALDLTGNLVAVDDAEQGQGDEHAAPGKPAIRRQPRHGCKRFAKREIEMQADGQVTAVHA